MSDAGDQHPQHPQHRDDRVDIEVVKGNPNHDELAALIAVLSKIVAPNSRRERNMWGHPVDMLRYPIFSWQRVTLLERTHMRR